MGIVYKASDERLVRTEAIKELQPDTVNGIAPADAKALFYQEMRILSSLRHAHLPHVYDWFEEGGRYYLVMEFIEGETLLKQMQRMPGRPLPIDLILHYAVQLCDVLIYLHDEQHPPVIFRDLKPSNIMVTPKGEVYLIDFGIARLFKTGKFSDTRDFGTLGYVAPEVGFTQTDARSDIYSLGVTLHYCLTLLEPERKLHAQFSPILPYNKQVSPALNDLVVHMVEHSPGDRPASMKQVKQALEDIRQQMRVVAAPMSNTSVRTANRTSAKSSSPRVTPAMPLSSASGPSRPYPDSQPGSFQAYNAPTTSVHSKSAIGFSPSPNIAARPGQPVGTPLQQVQSSIIPVLLLLLSTGEHFFTLVLLPQLQKLGQAIQRGLVFCLSPAFRGQLSGVYRTSRQRLEHSSTHLLALQRKLTGVWTPHFLLLLGVCLAGSILFSFLLYRTLGGSYYRVELGLAFVLLLSLIIIRGFMHHPVPRNILICTGVFVTLDILMLAIQQITEGTQQPVTFSTFLTYSIAMLALVALIGKVATREMAPPYHVMRPTSWFTRSSHIALAAIASTCLSLQYLLGQQEQIPLVAAMQPLARRIVGTLTLNDVLLCLPAGILLLSLCRFKRPFKAIDRVLLCLLSILYIPLQYTYGQAELTHIHMFDQTSAANIALINLLLITAPLAAVGVALSWARGRFEWLDQTALLTLALVSGWLQNFQQRLFFLAQGGEGLHLAALGQLLFYTLGIAVLILLVRTIFFLMAKQHTITDRIASLVVVLGTALLEWAFWQRMLQQAQPASNTDVLYGYYLALYGGWLLIALAALTFGIVIANTLFRLSSQSPWLDSFALVMDRLTVLITAVSVLVLLISVSKQSNFPVLSLNAQAAIRNAPVVTIPSQRLLIALLSIAIIITLMRRKHILGRIERMAMLLSGCACLLTLVVAGNLQGLPLLSSDMQQPTEPSVLALSIDRIAVTCILAAALISFFWLTRSTVSVDRIVLGLVFGTATLFILMQYMHIQHVLLLTALILLLQGVLVATQIESVYHSNIP
jgi:serine/threonine protein kinase